MTGHEVSIKNIIELCHKIEIPDTGKKQRLRLFLNKIKFIFLSFWKFISENRKMYILGYKKNPPLKINRIMWDSLLFNNYDHVNKCLLLHLSLLSIFFLAIPPSPSPYRVLKGLGLPYIYHNNYVML